MIIRTIVLLLSSALLLGAIAAFFVAGWALTLGPDYGKLFSGLIAMIFLGFAGIELFSVAWRAGLKETPLPEELHDR